MSWGFFEQFTTLVSYYKHNYIFKPGVQDFLIEMDISYFKTLAKTMLIKLITAPHKSLCISQHAKVCKPVALANIHAGLLAATHF